MTQLRPDLAVIARHIAPGTRALDVGCGEGELMEVLQREKAVIARGMEIDPELVERAMARGLSVVQGDADHDLAEYPDEAFDYAILSQTLQTAERPDRMLDELLRVGRRAFVSFPNFAYWRMRFSLLFHGRMPVVRHLPVSWYETQNIHHVTVEDFRLMLLEKGVTVERSWFFANGRQIDGANINWRAEHAVYQLISRELRLKLGAARIQFKVGSLAYAALTCPCPADGGPGGSGLLLARGRPG